MPRPTAQAQNTINKLLSAGWKRNQFSVRTERINFRRHPDTGKQVYEYGDVIISLRNSSKSERSRKAKAMADQGLHIELYQFANGHWAYPFVADVYWLKPGVYIKREGQIDKYGLSIVRKVY
jgi:hypothetical protein